MTTEQEPPDDKEPHRRLAKVQFKKEDILLREEDAPNILRWVREALVITVSGEIWRRYFSIFNCSEELVKQAWDRDPQGFVKWDQQ